MSSIVQNVLMAFTVKANAYYSSKVQAVRRREVGRRPDTRAAPATTREDVPRRSLVLSAVVVASATSPQLGDSASELLQRYLKKSEENKEKNDKERQESYYKRNYKDYFDFVEGGLRVKSEDQLTDAEKGILDWLKRNQ